MRPEKFYIPERISAFRKTMAQIKLMRKKYIQKKGNGINTGQKGKNFYTVSCFCLSIGKNKIKCRKQKPVQRNKKA